MDIARLVLDYLKVIIWPAVTVVIVYGFRSQLKDLIRRVRMLSAPGVDAEFSNEVIAASADAEVAVLNNHLGGPDQSELPPVVDHGVQPAVPPGADSSGRPQGSFVHFHRVAPDDDPLLTLAETHSNAAVVAAFLGVEAQLRRLEEQELPASRLRWPVRRLAERLNLPSDIRASIIELSEVRNRVTHGHRYVVTPEAARTYVRSCREMIDWLEERGQQQMMFDLE
ncbi:hypothetical protein [Streptomyces sp. NPDC006309]|uniref:hypothetical protein n=1 Tax=Streptomyces sp. NPDC006309 TaxID=3156749 RepID=UPI0033B6BD36